MASVSKTQSPKYICHGVSQLPPRVQSLIYWDNPIETAIVLIAGFTALLSLGCLSFISFAAYLCLAVLCCTAAARVYYDFVKSKRDDCDLAPFADWISGDINVSRGAVTDFVDKCIDNSETSLKYLRHVIFIESYGDSLKFSVCVYLLSIFGGFFNLITVVVICFALSFSVPKVYDIYHLQIDKVVDQGKTQFDNIWSKVKVYIDKIPMLRKQKEN